MDISNELELMRSNFGEMSSILQTLSDQEKELAKKTYLIKVVGISSAVESMINLGKFEDCGVKSMKLTHVNGIAYGSSIKFTLKDKNRNEMKLLNLMNESKEYTDLTEKLETLFSLLRGFGPENLSEGFTDATSKEFTLKKGADKLILQLLLSDELKAVLEYSQLQNSLETNETNKPKKVKI